MLQLLIQAPTFLSFGGKQSAGSDRICGEWCTAHFFAPICILEAHLSLAAQRRSQVYAVWMPQLLLHAAHGPTIYPLSCLVWFEETSDSLFALPEASLFLLVIVIWKFRLFPVSDIIITITAPSCKEIMFLHPSKDWSIESYTFFFPCWITLICCVWGWMKSNTITVFSMQHTSSQSIQWHLDCFRSQVKWLDFHELTLSYPLACVKVHQGNCTLSMKGEKAGNGIPLKRSFQKRTD